MGGETEVAIAYQPSYPLRGRIAAVTIPAEVDPGDMDPDETNDPDGDRAVLWIATDQDNESPYAPRWPWQS